MSCEGKGLSAILRPAPFCGRKHELKGSVELFSAGIGKDEISEEAFTTSIPILLPYLSGL